MRDDHLWAAVKITEAAVTQLFNGASTPNEVKRGQQIGEIVAELYTAIYAGIVEADYRVGKIAPDQSTDQKIQSPSPVLESKLPKPKLPESKPVEVAQRMEPKPVEVAQRMEPPVVAPVIASNVGSSVESSGDEFPQLESLGIRSIMESHPSAPADDPETNAPANAPAFEAEASGPAHLFADLMASNSPVSSPATDLAESVSSGESAFEAETSAPANTPADDMETSAPSIATGDVKDNEPAPESAVPAITMGDVWERIGSPRSTASRFFDR